MGERLRRSVDCPYYRTSLDSIAEYHPFYPPNRVNSFESPLTIAAAPSPQPFRRISDPQEQHYREPNLYAEIDRAGSLSSRSSPSTAGGGGLQDQDGNVYGEWNNFWLNYNCARARLQQNAVAPSTTCEDGVSVNLGEESVDGGTGGGADGQSTPQKEEAEKRGEDEICLSRAEVAEAIGCCRRVIEVLQDGLRRNDFLPSGEDGADPIRKCSIYLEQQQEHQKSQSFVEPLFFFLSEHKQNRQISKENSISQASCINNLFGSGVTDYLKKVIQKRKHSDVGVP